MRHAPGSSFTDATPLSTRSAPAGRRGVASMGAKILWLLGLPARVVAVRRDMALLGRMSAGELADIGLCRQDVHDAAALRFGEAPGALLGRRAAERRRAALHRRR